MFDVDEYLKLLRSERLKKAVKVQSRIIQFSRDFLAQKDFVEILPVIISPITDPLTDYRVRGEVECYGFKYQITKSMIFHKQISLLSLPRIFCFSPNVRIEPLDRQRSGQHLVEFVQLDLEMKSATREEIIELGEKLLIFIFQKVKESCASDLEFFRRELRIPTPPFKKVFYDEAQKIYGRDYEMLLSQQSIEPVWLLDFPVERREFYDREYAEKPGVLKDMDLIYPEGFGEALSGGEREFEYEKIKKRIEQKKIDLKAYEIYLDFARKGLFPSAGFGIGVERLTRFILGLSQIQETRFFAKLPGVLSL